MHNNFFDYFTEIKMNTLKNIIKRYAGLKFKYSFESLKILNVNL